MEKMRFGSKFHALNLFWIGFCLPCFGVGKGLGKITPDTKICYRHARDMKVGTDVEHDA